MNRSDFVVFVSAGMLSPKKRDHRLARRQLYLNYGALTLATKLELIGYRPVLAHGEHQEPAEFLNRLFGLGYLPSKYPLMLSVPSFYALEWARSLCQLLVANDPACRIVVGGRWVVGPDMDWFRTKLPEATSLAPGLGEPVVEDLLLGKPVSLARPQAPTPIFPLNHRLVLDYEAFQPSVEASRGCGMGCSFCEERDIRLERLRPPEKMADFLEITSAQYRGGVIHPYFQSSFFAPPFRWAEHLASEVSRRKLSVAWRSETRVDAMDTKTVAALAAAGLKILDLGLETASPCQILAMSKATKPDIYLQKASDLVRSCRDNGVWVKANVLLYAGETAATLAETTQWLDQHADCIKGVSVGPVIAFGPPRTANILLDAWKRHGARPVEEGDATAKGITTMHLSSEIDAASAEAISLDLSRRYMTADDYFELKSFSYYPRGFGRADFDADVAASDPNSLPFRQIEALSTT